MEMKTPEQVIAWIRDAGSVAVCCHLNPDGDAIGSALAMRLALIRAGKRVSVFCKDKVPDNLMMLPDSGTVRRPVFSSGEQWDLLLLVDVSDGRRVGFLDEIRPRCGRTAQIDHHGTNPLFCEANWVEEGPATALLIYRLLKLLEIPLDREIASCLYAGVSTDTGNFSFPNVTPEVFAMARDLMENDLPLAKLSTVLFREKPMAQAKLTGRALESMVSAADGRITVMRLTRADFEACGALEEHADTIVNQGLDIAGVKMAALLRETEDGKVKCSLRAKDGLRVDTLAAFFGGGGHGQASGATLDGPLDKAFAKMSAAMEQSLSEQLKTGE